MNLEEIVNSIEPADQQILGQAQEHTSRLVMPPRALGRLNEIGERICAIQRTLKPSVKSKAILVMAGDHGIVAQGVSAFPQEVTGEMVKTFLSGGAGINVLARQTGASVYVVDMGIIPDVVHHTGSSDTKGAGPGAEKKLIIRKIARGTKDFTHGLAMTKEEALKSIESGYEVASRLVQEGVELLGTGDMGIGNTTPSSAVGAVITGQSAKEMTGRGTGVDDETFARKSDIIESGISINAPDPKDAIDILSKVGGFEIGGIAGAILAAARFRKPVVIDGLISTAGALIAYTLCPAVADYMFAGHRSVEQGHGIMLEHIGLEPLLDLGMRLGEGTGGALAMHIIEAGVRVFREVATFDEAGVSESVA